MATSTTSTASGPMTSEPTASDLGGVPEPHRSVGAELLRITSRRSAVPRGAVLETSAFRLLWLLSDDEPRTLREVAEALDLEQSTVNRQVNAALRAGYVERLEPASGPGRVRPTPSGTAAFEHDGAIRLGLLSAVLAELGEDRTASLLGDLRAFNDAYDQHAGRP